MKSRCISHRADEEIGAAHRVCPSCSHVYASPEDLVREANALLRLVGLDEGTEPFTVTDVAAVDQCPLCLIVFPEGS